MTRLQESGVAVPATVRNKKDACILTEADFRDALVELCPNTSFDSEAIHVFYRSLYSINDPCPSKRDRSETLQMAKLAREIGRDLESIAGFLRSHDRPSSKTAILLLCQLKGVMEKDPKVRSLSKANRKIDSFRDEAARLAHTCSAFAASLDACKTKRGRPRNDYYDTFTRLLLMIACVANVSPRLWKDRDKSRWHGWLVEAATKLEPFLVTQMRSPTLESRGKRLERSMKRLFG
jgi:hypothetical protein